MWRNFTTADLSGSFNLIREAWVKDGSLYLTQPSNGGILVQKGWLNGSIAYRQSPDFGINVARVFILVGQSNMVGDGGYYEYLDSNIFDNTDNVLVDDTNPSESPNPTGFMSLQQSADRSVGAQVLFGERLSKAYPDDKIVLIKCSQAGTGLDYWGVPGNLGHDVLFERIDAVTGWLDTMVTNGDITDYQFEAILSVQGENEADGIITVAQQYDVLFENMVSEIRNKVNMPNLPVILSKLSESISSPGALQDGKIQIVRDLQESWANNDGYSSWFDTNDMYLLDEFHYGPYSQQEMGRRFAESWFANYMTRPYALITPISGQEVQTNDSTIHYRVLFNKPVSGLSSSNLQLVTDTSGAITNVTAISAGYDYDVSVSGMLYPGTMKLLLDQNVVSSNLPSINRNSCILYSHHAGVSDLLAYEGLTNQNNQPLHLLKSGKGFTNVGWIVQNGGPGFVASDSSPMSYGDLDISPYYASGGGLYNSINRYLDLEVAFRNYSNQKTGAICGVDVPGTTLWMSYVLRVNFSPETHQVAAMNGFGETFGAGNNLFQVYNSGGTWHCQIRTQTAQNTGVSVTTGTYLMVWRLHFDSAGTSTAHLWINPDNSTLGGADLSLGTANGSGSVSLDNEFVLHRILWYPGSSPGYGDLDELRIGLTYASVTPTNV